jgi:hypothetical protein
MVEGPSRALNLRDTGRTKPVTSKERLDDQGFRELDSLLQNEPELGRVLAGAILKKNFGVDLPATSTYEDRLFQSELETNPEYRQQYLEKAMQDRGVKAKKHEEEPDDFDRLLLNLEKANKLRAAIGDGGQENGWQGIVKEAVKGVGSYIQSGGRIPLPGAPVPAIAQQQQPPMAALRHPAEPVMPASPAPAHPPDAPSEGRIVGAGMVGPEPEPRGEDGEKGAAMPINLEGIDWMSLMPLVDWVELEAQTGAPPGEFAQTVYTRCYEDDSKPHALLRDIFLGHSPQAIVEAFTDLGRTIQKPWVVSMAAFAGKTGDIEAAQRIIERMTLTSAGHQWVAEAVAAMRIIEERLLVAEAEAEGEAEAEAEAEAVNAVPVSALSEPYMANGLSTVHPGLHGVLGGDGDDDDDENSVVG